MKLLDSFKMYFGENEMFSPDVYHKYGRNAWQFIRPELMEVLLWIREGIGKPMTINNWAAGQTQRGFRENTCDIVRGKTLEGVIYCGAHNLGAGTDFNVKGQEAEETRNWIRKHIDECPYPIRVERRAQGKIPSWVHVDTMNITDEKLVEFDG